MVRRKFKFAAFGFGALLRHFATEIQRCQVCCYQIIYLIFAVMKILSFIFFAYILYLSTVPCCTIDTCTDEINQVQELDPNNQKDNCNNCSPFFTCGNCSGVVQVTEPIQLSVLDIPKQVHHDGLIFLIPISYTALHLQPPRVA